MTALPMLAPTPTRGRAETGFGDVVVLMGPPLSGKSTYAYDRVLTGTSNPGDIVSLRDMTETLDGPDGELTDPDTEDLFMRVVEQRIGLGLPVVVDAPNLDPYNRLRIVEKSLEHGMRPVVVVFDVPWTELVRRLPLADREIDYATLQWHYEVFKAQAARVNQEFDWVVGGY